MRVIKLKPKVAPVVRKIAIELSQDELDRIIASIQNSPYAVGYDLIVGLSNARHGI